MVKYKKEELEKLIFIEKLSYEEIGRRYDVTGAYIKKVSKNLGLILTKRANFPSNWVPHNYGTQKKKNCLNCNNEFLVMYSSAKYCSNKCQAEHRIDTKYNDYINNQEKYCYVNGMKFIKPHIANEQNNTCNICQSPDKWNNRKLVFVLDHIDGDASNNRRNNLRLICPNCDSQLDTYKSKNKNSARKERYLQNYKN